MCSFVQWHEELLAAVRMLAVVCRCALRIECNELVIAYQHHDHFSPDLALTACTNLRRGNGTCMYLPVAHHHDDDISSVFLCVIDTT